jgi:anaphase-promoting complex subunit 6
LDVVCARYETAVDLFNRTLELAKGAQNSAAAWTGTRLNLGHAFRKLKWVTLCVSNVVNTFAKIDPVVKRRYAEAKATYERVIDLDPKFALAYSSLAMVLLTMNEREEAINQLHEVILSIHFFRCAIGRKMGC